MPRKINFAI